MPGATFGAVCSAHWTGRREKRGVAAAGVAASPAANTRAQPAGHPRERIGRECVGWYTAFLLRSCWPTGPWRPLRLRGAAGGAHPFGASEGGTRQRRTDITDRSTVQPADSSPSVLLHEKESSPSRENEPSEPPGRAPSPGRLLEYAIPAEARSVAKYLPGEGKASARCMPGRHRAAQAGHTRQHLPQTEELCSESFRGLCPLDDRSGADGS